MRKCQKLDKKQQNELECFIKDKNHSSREIVKAQVVLMLDKELALDIVKNLTGYSRRRSFSIRKQLLPIFEKIIRGEKNNGVKNVYLKALKILEKDKEIK